MSKQTQFAARAQAHGQQITIHPFSAWPSGDYLDSSSGLPDPEHKEYPATIPEPTYQDAVTVYAFVQPLTTQEGGEVYVRAPWGEEVRVALRAYVPGSQAVAHRDKIVYNSTNYWVAKVEEWKSGGVVVFREVHLTESVPRAG